MSNLNLKTITFPELNNTYEVAVQPDGKYDNLTAGTASALLSDSYTEDTAPYKYRRTPYASKRLSDEIVGGSVVFNQLVSIPASSKSKTSNGVTFTDNRDGTYTVITESGGATADASITGNTVSVVAGHKYYYKGAPQGGSASTYQSYLINTNIMSNARDYGNGVIFSPNSSGAVNNVIAFVNSGTIISKAITFKPICIDLTAMFNPTIADYIYNLEQTTAGAGVAAFRAMFAEDYYAYNAGELVSIEGLSAKVTTGFNQWDEEWEVGSISPSTGANATNNDRIRSKGYIPVIGGESYYLYVPVSDIYIVRCWYDSNKNYISGVNTRVRTEEAPQNAAYLRFAVGDGYGVTYKNDICINISDTAKNGTYEPYDAHTYPLDASLTLRGIPKLDSNNKLYFDGDRYASDGTVTRRYGVVDLGTLTWDLADSTNAIFKTTQLSGHLSTTKINYICGRYTSVTADTPANASMPDKSCKGNTSQASWFYVRDSSYSDAATFKTAMSGVYLVYELVTPTTETAQPYQEIQICSPDGTEEYVFTGIVPIGHETKYYKDIISAIEGIPDAPTANGTYVLKCTVSGGVATYSWES